MNKIQIIELLKIRGITKLISGETVADAIKKSGGEVTLEEMILVNQKAMEFYIQKYKESQEESYDLRKKLSETKIENFKLKQIIESNDSI